MSPSRRCAGLTLLELLVVLTILATLATVAVTSTTGFADQARYEGTQRTLTGVREAMLGPQDLRDSDGSPLRTGFVADIGRLPRATARSVTGGTVFTLSELWEKPAGVQSYAILPAAAPNIDVPTGSDPLLEADPEVMLGVGWRGPYLQLAPGEPLLRDGWGKELVTPNGSVPGYGPAHLRDIDSAPIAGGGEVARVLSFGSNDLEDAGDSNYDRDLGAPLDAPLSAADFKAQLTAQIDAQLTVQVQVRKTAGVFPAGAHEIAVRFFAPNPANGRIFVTTESPATLGGIGSDTLTGTVAFAGGAGVPTPTIGLRALRAYYSATGTPVTADPKSAVALLTVRPGQNVRTLVITVP